jgi:hypothetical protein
MLKIPQGMIEILIGNIQQPFVAQIFSALLLGVCAATRAENFGG